MSRRTKIAGRVAVLLAVFTLPGCEDPKLQADLEKESPLAEEKEVDNSIAGRRSRVIGKVFSSLTLGTRQFMNAEVRDINDSVIVVAHAGGVDEVSWDIVPQEVRDQWGYDPYAAPFVEKDSKASAPSKQAPSTEISADASVAREDIVKEQSQFQEIARQEKMLEAQMTGIRILQSDLARHTLALNDLKAQLQTLRARQSSQKSGGVRIENLTGSSSIVDRRGEMRELEGKIRVEEELVASFSASLEKARNEYQTMRLGLDRLRNR